MKGIYVLIIKINKTTHPHIGVLGEIDFPSGLYAYVGSAQNSLEMRVKRHLRKEKRLFWHIDYLLVDPVVEVTESLLLRRRQNARVPNRTITGETLHSSAPLWLFGLPLCKSPVSFRQFYFS